MIIIYRRKSFGSTPLAQTAYLKAKMVSAMSKYIVLLSKNRSEMCFDQKKYWTYSLGRTIGCEETGNLLLSKLLSRLEKKKQVLNCI